MADSLIGKVLAALTAFIITVISRSGYTGIVVLMAIESACIPLPSEIIMPFSGALTVAAIAGHYGRDPLSLVWVATAGALGCNLGSAVAYFVGYHGGRSLAERYGAYVFLTRRELEMADRFFARWGSPAVFIARLLPVIRTFIALPAGIARMPQVRFHLYTFVGSWPWCFALAWVGMKLGERWESDPRLRAWFHRFDVVIAAALLAGIVWFVWTHWKNRIRAAS